MPRYFIILFIVLLVKIALSTASFASERIALVIGNSNYKHVGHLPNPKNDAELMATSLEIAGFKVNKLIDVDYRTLKRSIIAFGRKLRESPEAGLFYFAGHGIQVGGENYLIPVDANITDEDEVDLEAVNVNNFLRVMRASNSDLNIVVLDACRDNPFSRSFRSSSRGLAPVDAPRGTYIAYSTAPGNVAADGDGNNSPYTLALAKSINQRGTKIEDVFKNARKIVLETTKNKQVPWESSSITGDFYFHKAVVKKPEVVKFAKPEVSSIPSKLQLAEKVYEQIKDSSRVSEWEILAKEYPKTIYARFALARIKELNDFGRIDQKFVIPQLEKPELYKETANVLDIQAERGWKIVSAESFSDMQALKQFASKFKTTRFAIFAKQRIYDLGRAKIRDNNESVKNRWESIQSNSYNDLDALREFVAGNSRSQYAIFAKQRIHDLGRVKILDGNEIAKSRWEQIQLSNNVEELRYFSRRYSGATYAKYAVDRIKLIESAERIRQSSAAKARLRNTIIAKKKNRNIQMAGATKNKKISSSGRWTAYQRDNDNGTSCNTQTKPIGGKSKGISSFFVSNWLFNTSRNDIYHQPSVRFVDKRLPVSKLTAEISGKAYQFKIQGKFAFPKYKDLHTEIVSAMKNKRRLITKTTASNGRVYTDTFSLSGVTNTLARIDQRCPALVE